MKTSGFNQLLTLRDGALPITSLSLLRLLFLGLSSSSSPLVAISYHLYELPLMRLSSEQTLAQGRRRQGLEWGKCPHLSSQYRALSGAQPLSAAGTHPGIADGGRMGRADLFSGLCLSECVFLKLIKSLPPVFFGFLLFEDSNCR